MNFPKDLVFLRTVGEGSFGRVVKVLVKNHFGLQKHCALKLIKQDILKDSDYFFSLKNELEIYKEINGEIFFPKLHSTFFSGERLCILTDYCHGGELLSLIHKVDGFDERQIKFYAAEVIMALKCLHDRNILYRDLKSENLLINKEGHIQLIDFGLSIKTDKNVLGRVGTTECMAPEIIKGESYNKLVDLWALGVLIYEMFYKNTPFSDDSVEKIEFKICKEEIDLSKINDKNLSDLISKLLEKDPKKRLGSKNGLIDVMNHSFFNGVNWENVSNFKCIPPINFEILCKGENFPHYRESIYSLMSFY